MEITLTLNKNEENIRSLLVDFSDHLGTLQDHVRPQVRFAGGWVRDKLLKLDNHDIDVCIDNMKGKPFALLLEKFARRPEVKARYASTESKRNIVEHIHTIPENHDKSKHMESATGKVFGFDLDFVHLRTEVYNESSRIPEVEFGTAKEDALRRDSTINSLFYNLTSSKVEDFTGRGLEDLLNHKVIKTPLAPFKTFRDDPLRILRSIRFASRLGFSIASEDEEAMSNSSIQEALKLKISRERVGTEVEKMLKGKDPLMALALIERLGLYDKVFTTLKSETAERHDPLLFTATEYMPIFDRFHAQKKDRSQVQEKASYHIQEEDRYHKWLLFALVPLARTFSDSQAAMVVREGLKGRKTTIKVVQDAFRHWRNIQDLLRDSGDTAKDIASLRLDYGRAIRRYGSDWVLHVLYAFFVEIAESDDSSRQVIAERYAAWLAQVEMLGLLEVYALKPLLNGHEVAQALRMTKGEWMTDAMNIVIDYQLRNWDERDLDKVKAELIARKEELKLIARKRKLDLSG